MTEPAFPSTQTAEAHFVGNLYGVNKRALGGNSADRAVLARLRRSLGVRDLSLAALRDVGMWLPERLEDDTIGEDDALDAYLLTAALFALYQPPATHTSSDRPSFGKTLRGLRGDLSAGAESLDRRMTALLDADRDELPYRLRQLVQMLKGTRHVPDWQYLLWSLLRWDDPSRQVQRRWARDYWTGASN